MYAVTGNGEQYTPQQMARRNQERNKTFPYVIKKEGATHARVFYLVTARLIHRKTIRQAVAPTTQTIAALNGLDNAV